MCATSPKKPFRLSKRNREQSKTSAMHGRHNTMLTSERARVTTQWIGQSTLTSSRIATDADLTTESDSESLGAWQQKPSKNFLKGIDKLPNIGYNIDIVKENRKEENNEGYL